MEKSNRICVYAICKNEIECVERWYESMSEADCVVVLDTGSTDGTVEKLRSLGAYVIQRFIDPWRFDVARNIAMNLCPDDCNILVCTDIDQVFVKGWADILRNNWIDGKHRLCWYKFVYTQKPDGSDDCVFSYNKIHCRGYRWYFPVHECIDIDTDYADKILQMEELNLMDEIKLYNYPVYSNSHSCYLPLLKLRVEENPDMFSGYQYLSHQYCYDGQFEECIRFGLETIEKFKNTMYPIELANMYFFIGLSYKYLDKVDDALHYFKLGVDADETYRENYLEIADIYLYKSNDDNRFNYAYIYLISCLRHTYQHYSWLERSGTFTERVYDLLCQAAFYSGHKKDSLLYAFIAREKNSSDERLKSNVDIVLNSLSDKELA